MDKVDKLIDEARSYLTEEQEQPEESLIWFYPSSDIEILESLRPVGYTYQIDNECEEGIISNAFISYNLKRLVFLPCSDEYSFPKTINLSVSKMKIFIELLMKDNVPLYGNYHKRLNY